jgi:hypothetical protein
MDRNLGKETVGEGDGTSTPSESWLFAQALLGRAAPSASSAAADERAKREQLAWLAKISSEHESQLRRSLKEISDATAERAQLEWLAEISPRHESQLGRLLAFEAEARDAQERLERLVGGSPLQEFQWDPAKHPRRGGAPNAGWFATTGGTGSTAGSGGSAGKLDRAGRDGERDANGQHHVPPRMLELAGAWSQTQDRLDQYHRDIERLPNRIEKERAQLGTGGRYAYVHSQNLAKAQQDLETAKAQVPELEARLRDLKKEYHESGYDDVGYGTTTPGETFVGGRGIEKVGSALKYGGSPAGLKPTGVEVDLALGVASLRQLGKAGLNKALTKAPSNTVSKAATLKPYGEVGGHHIPAKSAFRGAMAYDAKGALAVSNEELARFNVRHVAVTGAQKTLYREFAKTGAKLTWEEVQRIETEALLRGGMSSDVARAAVNQAIAALKKAGVPSPTRIPWGN